jgi:hypothetical protein
MLTCLLVATGLLFYLAFRSEMPPVTIIINEGASVHICDGGAVSLKFQDFRESMPGGAGGVDDGQHGGATTIVDDACPSGVIGGLEGTGIVGIAKDLDWESRYRIWDYDEEIVVKGDSVVVIGITYWVLKVDTVRGL